MKLPSRLLISRKISLAAASFLSLANIASAEVPYADANPFERVSFGNEWGILGNDIFFGGADALFGLSPASRTLLLFSETESKSTSSSAAFVTEESQEDLSSFASALGSPFVYSAGGGLAPNAPDAPTPPDFYWDVNGSTPGTGGTGNWDFISAFWNDVTGATLPTNWVNGNIAHFTGTPGTVTIGANAVAPTVASFEVTGYTLQTDATATARSMNGPITLGAAVNLNLHNPTTTAARSLNIGGSISGGVGSTLTIQGTQSAANSARVNLSLANSTISVPIIINELGVGVAGVVATAAGQQITGATITNNSSGKTLLGAAGVNDTLSVSSVITGTQGLQISLSGTGGDGQGKVTLTGDNLFAGDTIVNTGTSGQLILNSTGQALGGTSNVLVNGGTLLWGASDQINNTAGVSLGGGTLALNGFSEGAPGTNGVGALTLTANSVIDFAANVTSSIIQFGGLGVHTPGTGPNLLITNWDGTAGTGGGPERLLFSGNTTDFTTKFDQSDVLFDGFAAGYVAVQFGDHYEILAPIPEPGTWAGAALALAAIGFMQRRRLRGLVTRGA